MLVQAGAPVDSTIDKLLEYMETGDIIIDGGNEWWDLHALTGLHIIKPARTYCSFCLTNTIIIISSSSSSRSTQT
jgi:hypothetical protein